MSVENGTGSHLGGPDSVVVQHERDDRQKDVERRPIRKVVDVDADVGDSVDVFEPVDERRRKSRQPVQRRPVGLERVAQFRGKEVPEGEEN